MLSFKRLLYIIFAVAILGGIFLIYSINDSRPANVQIPKREFIETNQVDEKEKIRIWMLGDSEDSNYGELYKNVRQYCEDIHLPVIEAERLDIKK